MSESKQRLNPHEQLRQILSSISWALFTECIECDIKNVVRMSLLVALSIGIMSSS
jgi:hypothetical protein